MIGDDAIAVVGTGTLAGSALLRDNTTSGGWILAYDNAGKLATRIAGTSFNTGK